MKLIIFTVLFLTSITAKAQSENTGSISVIIKDDTQHPIENATVELLKSKDSSLVKVAVSNNEGIADFDNIVFGTYIIKASSVNLVTKYSAPYDLSNSVLTAGVQSIVLSSKSTNLKEVIVEGKKPFILKFSDRIVVNV
ncbi:MAG: SpaA isopeptide-forming pilin-related protein, partial [Ginsengibacter sp.]